MRTIHWIRTAACVVGSGVALSSPVKAQAPEIPAAVKTHIQQRIDRGFWTGVVVGAVDSAGVTFFGYGHPSRNSDVAVDEHSVFEIGSITKTFTGVLLADLVSESYVALDDPIAALLPDEVTVPQRGDQPITLRHLSTHTSGLPRLPSNLAPADPTNPYADYTEALLYDFLSNHELRRDVGSEFEYSNYGAGLLGHILARRNQSTYEALVQSRITEPLGMPDTRIVMTEDMRTRLAKGHSGGEEVPSWDLPTLAGAGAIRSTAADMTRYVAANLGLVPSRLGAAFALSQQEHAPAQGGQAIGLGWIIRRGDSSEIHWHNGGTGGYRSFAGFDKTKGLGVVVLSNTNESVDEIGMHILDASAPLPEVPTPVVVSIETLDRYVGEYELQPGFTVTVTRRNDQLMVQATGQSEFPVYASSEIDFYLTAVEASITFVVEGDGPATALILHQNGDRRAERKQ